MGKPISASGFNDRVLIRVGRGVVDIAKFINEDTAAPNSGRRFCQLFDASSVASVTLGATVPIHVFSAASKDSDDNVFGVTGGTDGLVFDLGLVVASTTTPTGSTLATAGSGHFFVSIG